MAANVKTFGGAISEARKAKGWALKDLASRVLREDEEAISPQYLNDIEHDRRSPSSDRMVQQFADALGIDLSSRLSFAKSSSPQPMAIRVRSKII